MSSLKTKIKLGRREAGSSAADTEMKRVASKAVAQTVVGLFILQSLFTVRLSGCFDGLAASGLELLERADNRFGSRHSTGSFLSTCEPAFFWIDDVVAVVL